MLPPTLEQGREAPALGGARAGELAQGKLHEEDWNAHDGQHDAVGDEKRA